MTINMHINSATANTTNPSHACVTGAPPLGPLPPIQITTTNTPTKNTIDPMSMLISFAFPYTTLPK